MHENVINQTEYAISYLTKKFSPKKSLANILTYHVISGKIVASDVVAALKKGNGLVELTALNGQVISVIEKDGKIWLKDSNENYSEITSTDIMGSNGVIHVIDSVVMPK